MILSKKITTSVFAAVSLVLVSACSSSGSDTPNNTTGLFSKGEFETKLEELRATYNLPAMSAVIVKGDGTMDLAAVGERSAGSGIAVTTDDYWHIGSITKSMTSTLAAVLVDEGLIRWDSTIAEVFPDLADQVNEKYRSVELQQFLSMTGGVNDDIDDAILQQINVEDLTGEGRLAALPIVLGYDHGNPINEFLYANVSYVIAATMLEKSANESWRELLSSKVFAPTNITQFGFGPPGLEDQIDQPLGHTYQNEEFAGIYADNPPILDPAGRVHMSLTDLATYGKLHLDGLKGESSLVSSEVMQELYLPRTTETFEGGEAVGYALGWEVDLTDNTVFHTGSNTLWFAAFGVDVDRDIAIFVATNSYGMDATNDSISEIAVFRMLEFISDAAGEPDDL